MELVKPSEKYLQSYYEACQETWGKVHNNYILHNPDEFENWKNKIFEDYKNFEKGINLPDGYVPSVTYWIINNGEYIGTINIRLKLNDNLIKYGGSIGVFVRTSKRKGVYGVKAFLLALEQAKKLNISPILVTCQEENTVSLRLLTSKFSKYDKEEKDEVEIDGKIQKIRRFWFK